MPQYDRCHPTVLRALQKDGWKITGENELLRTEERIVFVDLKAERGSNGAQQQIMLCEVKCFADFTQRTVDLYAALGQYLIYQAVLDEIQDTTRLYLAVPTTAYDAIFDSTARRVVRQTQIKIVLIDLKTEQVARWLL